MVLALILLCTRYELQNSYSTWTDGVSSDPPVYQVSCKTLGQTQDSCFCHTVHKPIQTLKYVYSVSKQKHIKYALYVYMQRFLPNVVLFVVLSRLTENFSGFESDICH